MQNEVRHVLGIDPGLKGGWAVVKVIGKQLIAGERMTTMTHRGKKLIDARKLHQVLSDAPRIDVAVIEQVHAMPRQGVSSSFTFGRVTGAAESVAMLVAPRVEWVSPATWKRALGLSSDKRESLDAAAMAFGSSTRWDVAANDGIAEAALLARYWIAKNI